MAKLMKAAAVLGPGKIALQDVSFPEVGPTDALLRITTTICGTGVQILKLAIYP